MTDLFEKLKKYNYWEKEKVEFGFQRDFYLDKFSGYLDNKLIKVLVGQRRSGKSYVLRQIIGRLINQGINPKNIFYFNKELLEFESVDDYRKLQKLIDIYREKLKPKGKVYLFLDEIQEIEKWEKLVNSFSQNYKDQYELFITGSNSNLLSGELATYLSGRYVSFEVLPFSFDEYAKFLNIAKDKGSFLKYLQTGGLPEMFQLQNEEARRHYVSSLKDTIVLKDIVRRYGVKDVALLESVFKFLGDNIGSLSSINNIVGYLNSHKNKTNIETISNYINYFTQTFLIYEVERYNIKGKEILARNKKYYLNDLSFIGYLSSGYDIGPGKLLENIVYLHYRRLGYKIYVGKIYNEEVDFIVENDQEKMYIQVAYLLSDKKVIAREYKSLERINDNYQKLVISLDEVRFKEQNGIKHLSIFDLL